MAKLKSFELEQGDTAVTLYGIFTVLDLDDGALEVLWLDSKRRVRVSIWTEIKDFVDWPHVVYNSIRSLEVLKKETCSL